MGCVDDHAQHFFLKQFSDTMKNRRAYVVFPIAFVLIRLTGSAFKRNYAKMYLQVR